MPKQRPLNLERFMRTPVGLREFVKLIEQANPTVQKVILERTRKEQPKFLDAALRKTIFFEEIIYLDDAVLAEILSSVPAKMLAFATQGMTEEFTQKVFSQVGFRILKEIEDERSKIASKGPSSLSLGAQKHILKVARDLEDANKILIDLSDCPRLKAPMKIAA